MITVVEQKHAAGTPRHQECKQGSVSLGGIAGATGEYQIVGPVVGRHAAARPHVIEGDGLGGHPSAAIRTDRPVPIEEPFAMRTV
jgi:hypothetical protein